MYSIFIVFILLLSTMHRVVLIHWMLRRTVRARSTRVLYERSISMHTTSRSMHTSQLVLQLRPSRTCSQFENSNDSPLVKKKW